ncbi:MBL fold metallo-hydrolase [Gordonibacter sp.]|uniref:MBL fold metallo-hydrolase n=1 Tax=Gordonibacter sp. TaxID=1968902 RepID=UPI002FC9BDA4
MLVAQVHSNPDVFEARVPFENISTNNTNCYIVKDGDDALVVDTGAPSDEGFAILDAALVELGVDRARLRFFLTHLHLDHAGLVDRIALPGAKLYVSPVDFEAVRASRAASSYDVARRAFVAEGVSPSDASGYARYAVEPRLFDASRLTLAPSCEGDVVEVGRYCFRVMETPGHTPGHLALYEPESRILFSGDHILFVISPSIALFPGGGDGLQAYLDSLAKVRKLGVKRLFISHGESRDDFDERIDWLAAHHLERLEETRGIVGSAPRLTGEEVIRAIKWNVPFDAWEDISFVQRWCIVTEGVVILNHLVDRNLIRREADEAGINRYFCDYR